ncbi:hypothetical protein H0H87_006746 [Tephrocybe sp. NHM501043]|nr:hypothetical protein H0H87_006746 [Tephrocybe sp. NHM501043]
MASSKSFNLKTILKALSPSRDGTQNNLHVVKNSSATAAILSSGVVDNRQVVSSSRGEFALEAANPALRFMAAVGEAVPIAGGPLKGVANALLVLLDAHDVSMISSMDGTITDLKDHDRKTGKARRTWMISD